MKNISFVTTNSYKFELAQQFFQADSESGYQLKQYDLETPEIQSDSEEEVAIQSAIWVSNQIGELAISSDVAFHIDALGGFPGPFVKFANKWLRPNDILNLMRPYQDRAARFTDVLALASPGGDAYSFTSEVFGKIVDIDFVADTKWTMDAVFIPDGHIRTLADMDENEKDSVWNNDAWIGLMNHLKGVKS